MGIRFPFRAELFVNPMRDDPVFAQQGRRPLLFLAEVKLSTCGLNASWRDRRCQNMQRALRALGFFESDVRVNEAASALYAEGRYDAADWTGSSPSATSTTRNWRDACPRCCSGDGRTCSGSSTTASASIHNKRHIIPNGQTMVRRFGAIAWSVRGKTSSPG
jgi:hypothetical protein